MLQAISALAFLVSHWQYADPKKDEAVAALVPQLAPVFAKEQLLLQAEAMWPGCAEAVALAALRGLADDASHAQAGLLQQQRMKYTLPAAEVATGTCLQSLPNYVSLAHAPVLPCRCWRCWCCRCWAFTCRRPLTAALGTVPMPLCMPVSCWLLCVTVTCA